MAAGKTNIVNVAIRIIAGQGKGQVTAPQESLGSARPRCTGGCGRPTCAARAGADVTTGLDLRPAELAPIARCAAKTCTDEADRAIGPHSFRARAPRRPPGGFSSFKVNVQ
jgi:hypothetical protein